MSTPAISVVVCSFNGGHRLGATLDALTSQVTAASYEIIVVDDGSTDDTAKVATRPGVRLVSPGVNQGLSAARNIGFVTSRAPIVAFTDDDCIPGPSWVDDLVDAWSAMPPQVVALGGHTHARDTDSLCRRYVAANNPLAPLEFDLVGKAGPLYRLWNYLRTPDTPQDSRWVYSLVGANMSFRRTALDEVGGFDPVIRFGGDEEDLCRRLRARFGERCLWAVSSISIAHDFDRSVRDTLRRSRAYGRGNGRDFARHGGLPALRPGPVLATGAAALVAPWSPMAALGVLALAPFAVYRRFMARACTGQPEAIVYPYLAASQELWANRGFVEGWWKTRQRQRTAAPTGER